MKTKCNATPSIKLKARRRERVFVCLFFSRSACYDVRTRGANLTQSYDTARAPIKPNIS